MADNLPTTKYYSNLGGVNQKSSQYEMSTAQFLDLRNLDFDVPNALQKRPGQTYAFSSGAGTSGPINSLFEFVKLTGESYIIAGSDTAMFYIANNGLTLLSSGWSNGQPTDMLTFADKLWMANGQKWQSWDGSTLLPVGLPIESRNASLTIGDYVFDANSGQSTGGSYFLVNGATMFFKVAAAGLSMLLRGMYVAYSYNREDGYAGPADFLQTARNIVRSSPGNGNEYFTTSLHNIVGGFTIPAGKGITSISLWIAEDTISTADTTTYENIPNVGLVATGKLGWNDNPGGAGNFVSYTLKPDADLSRFWLFTTMPTSSLFGYSSQVTGETFYALSFTPGQSFGFYDSTPPLPNAFSAMPFDFFSTYTPKYIEINNNMLLAGGFSVAPSVVWPSEIGEPEFYNPENSIEVRTNDGDIVLGTASYNNQWLVFKEKSFHRLFGEAPDQLSLVQVSDQYGCISNKSVVQYDQKILWLDKKGVLEYNGANHQILSGPIEGIFKRMNLTAAKEKACGVHALYRNQLWWGIPIDGATKNNFTVVYDYLIGAWTFFDGFSPAAFASVRGALNKPAPWRGDYSGMVHFFGESFFSDSGQGITCLARTRFENVGGENQTSLWRRLFLDTTQASGLTGTINGQVFSNYDQSTVQATFTMYQTQFQSRVEMGVLGKAVSVQFSHSSASLPLLINGYAWANRGLRNV